MADYLIDKSAFARLHRSTVKERLNPMIMTGRIAMTGVVMAEILFSAQDRNDYDMQRSVLESMPRVGMNEATVDRALDIQAAMARVGTHRSACVPDLLIAACAQMNGLTVLHYDSDYDTIAAVTGQPTEWVVPAGTA